MALKAGRVGVAPDQVDEFGNINSEATSGYTKQEADAKFETQTHAASTYETKSEASTALGAKQNIQLQVPIQLLDGSALTVENALSGINGQFSPSSISDGYNTNFTKSDAVAEKFGKAVFPHFRITGVTATAYATTIATVKPELRPKELTRLILQAGGVPTSGSIDVYGAIKINKDVSDETIVVDGITWLSV